MSTGLHSTTPVGQLSDTRLAALAEEHGTPLFVYDFHNLRETVASLLATLNGAGATLLFATMANDCLPVLQLLATLGVGACVNSLPHLLLAREAGFAVENTQFTSTGMTSEDMRALQHWGIRANVDSLSQLEEWLGLGATEVGVRINAASLDGGVPFDRMGIAASHLDEALALASRCGGCVTGLHVYAGTNFRDADEMLPTLGRFFDLATRVPHLSYINLGGGIGVDYQHSGALFDLHAYAAGVSAYAHRLRARLGRHVQVIVEPGRALTAECGTLVVSVSDVKELGDRRFAIVDGSVAILPRPLLHPESPHRIRQLLAAHAASSVGASRDRLTVVVGRTTFSRDILGSAALADNLEVGDLLAMDDAGAYGQSMATRFLGQPEPHVVFVDD